MGVIDSSKVNDPEEAAVEIVRIFLKGNKKMLEKVYKIKVEKSGPRVVLKKIGKSRNMLKKGGIIDFNRVYSTVINDWQKGKLLLRE